MLFNSIVFLVLVAITFCIYYLPWLKKYQVHILILSSLVFYAYNNPALLLLLISSATINILTSYYVVFGNVSRRKRLATLGVVANLGILIFFKYATLLAHTFLSAGNNIGDFLVAIPLPIGISFYTFEGISLLVDTYGRKPGESNDIVLPTLTEHARKTMLFISFFPHLIAGPVLKAHDYIPQVTTKFYKDIDWQAAFKSIVTGYFLKMVVADNLKNFTFWMAYPYFKGQSTVTLFTLLFGYSCQIFADFAGYSLIAIGVAKLFGYNFKDNFNFPYISASFKEFWKRWHISLSTFLMEYLYIPLGGNRKGKVRTYLNLMITMFLGGLWHGAAWSYAIWGSFHGIALATERALTGKNNKVAGIVLTTLKRIMVFVFVSLAWLFFKLPVFSNAVEYLQTMFHSSNKEFQENLVTGIATYSLPVFLYHAAYLLKEKRFFIALKKFEYVAYGLMLFLIISNSGTSGTFIYFQF